MLCRFRPHGSPLLSVSIYMYSDHITVVVLITHLPHSTKAMEDMNPDDSKKKVKVDKKPKADEIKAIQEKNKKNAEGKDGDGELRQRKGKEAADADDDKDIPVIG
eukprot:TRINITY_DN2491_c1_g3_i1.p3 TRINITY_DN2491_c1_g3~~TRINITY_DN2491_c1_g3_i1.p3  ORF type:complete len:105 (-),score=46.46 TRINITY_DN2491_c1_g3_i1:196-510(-)